MRLCSGCNKEKKTDEFYRRNTGKRAGEYYEKCKDCMKLRGRDYYHQNQEVQLKLALLRKHRYKQVRRRFIDEFKKDKPCMDCGRVYPPWVMDFDHREGETKIKSVSHMLFNDTSNMNKIKLEIEKCDLVCSNCHRHRTYLRLIKNMPR